MAALDFGETTAAAQEERAKYRRHFARFDVFFFMLCALVGLDTLGTVATYGAQGFTFMILLAVLFFLPYGLLTAELGSTFTDEGAPYTWTRMAFGRFTAALNQVPSWLSNPIWLGGSLTILAITAVSSFLTPLNGAPKYIFAFCFIWFSILTAILSLDIGKWIPTIGAMFRVVLLTFFSLTVVVYGFQHGVHGFGASAFSPTFTMFLIVVPVLIFNFVGFETPNAAGEELKNPQKDVPFTVIRAGITTILCYGLPVLAIMLVIPASQITGLSGFLDAVKVVFTVYGGHVAKDGTATLTGAGQVLGWVMAIGFVWTLATSGAAWIMSADRAQAVAGYDGAAPRFFGRISARFGTPVVTNIVTGLMATLVMVMAFTLTGGNSGKYFGTVLSLAISTTTITYIPMFLAVIVLRYNRYRHVERAYTIPFGTVGLWFCGLITTAFCILGTIYTIYPGAFLHNPDQYLTNGWAGQRAAFERAQIIPLLVLGAIGVAFYLISAPTRRNVVVAVPEVAPEPVAGD